MLAVVKGIEKLGTRMCLLAIHPLEPGKTLSNTLLFNVAMLELCTFPVVQFVCSAFPTYVSSSAADALMGGAYENLSWLRYICLSSIRAARARPAAKNLRRPRLTPNPPPPLQTVRCEPAAPASPPLHTHIHLAHN